MRRYTSLAVIALTLAGSVALAQQAPTNPAAIARSENMKTVAASMRTLSDMAGGKTPFEAAGAEAALTALREAAEAIPVVFEANEPDPASKASPKIWSDWAGFVAEAGKLRQGASAIDASSAQSIGSSLGAAGGTCRSCHTNFRV